MNIKNFINRLLQYRRALAHQIYSSPVMRCYEYVFFAAYTALSAECFLAYVKTSIHGLLWNDFHVFWRSTHCVMWLSVLLRPKVFIRMGKKIPWVIALMLLFVYSYYWSFEKQQTAFKSVSLVTNFLFGLYVVDRFSAKTRERIVRIVLLFMLAMSLVLVFYFPWVGLMHDPAHFGSWQGIVAHKNHFGRIMSFATVLFLIAFTYQKQKLVWALVSILAAVCVIFSRSTTGLISLAGLTFLLLLVLYRKKPSAHRWTAVLISLIYILCAVHILAIKHPGYLAGVYRFIMLDRITVPETKSDVSQTLANKQDEVNTAVLAESLSQKQQISALEGLVVSYQRDGATAKKISRKMSAQGDTVHYVDKALSIVAREKTLTGRTAFWPILIEKMFQRPVLGYGFYGFWTAYNPAYLDLVNRIDWKVIMHSHNSFFDLILESGFAGLVLFFCIFVPALISAWRYAMHGNRVHHFYPLFFLSFMMLSNQTESGAFWVNYFFWPQLVIVSLWMASKPRKP